jgi:hypothetical protein
VLLGQQLRGRHDRRLISVLEREHRREERDDGLAAADVALQQAVHSAVAAHVGDDLTHRRRLRAGERERQSAFERTRQIPLVAERDSFPFLSNQRLGAKV